ncbi:MAG: IclR family transcriptional regulator [Solirubrobacteraceae bacterium]
MATEPQRERRGIQSVERAVAALRLLAHAGQGMGVSELARALGLPRGTIHGILRTLALQGVVEQDHETGRYIVGAAMLPIGFAYLATSRLRAAALGPTHALAARSRQSVRVGTLHRGEVLIVHDVSSDACRASEVGGLVPAHATAVGKVLLAHLPGELSQPRAGDLERYTPATITSVPRLRRELDEAPRRGWASSLGELSPGIASVAAPIAVGALQGSGAIEIVGPAERVCAAGSPRPELVTAVIDCARAISRALGGPVQ